MKGLLPLLLFLCPTQNAWAIRKATLTEQKEIRDAVDKATTIDKKLGKKRDDLENARRSGSPTTEYEMAVEALETKQKEAYNEAIQITIQAYEILPKGQGLPQEKMLKRGPYQNQTVTWVPMFDDYSPKKIIDEDGNHVATDPLLKNWGTTSSDGTSRIFPGAFLNPGRLASTIVHELTHFAQFTTPGPDGAELTPSEREVRAYNKEQELLDSGILGFSATEKAEQQRHITDKLNEKKPLAAAERAKLNTRGIRVTEVDIETPPNLAAIREGAVQLRQHVLVQASLPIAYEALNKFHKAMKAICDNPGNVGLGAGAKDFEAACQMWPSNLSRPWRFRDDQLGNLVGCEFDVNFILKRCPTPAEAAKEIDDAAQKRRVAATKKALPTLAKLAKAICAQKGRWSVYDSADYAVMCKDFDRDFMGDWYSTITTNLELPSQLKGKWLDFRGK